MSKSIYSTQSRKLAELLREAREKAGLNQEEVGRAFGKHQPTVARWESGERQIDVVELLKLAEILGFRASDMVQALESETSNNCDCV